MKRKIPAWVIIAIAGGSISICAGSCSVAAVCFYAWNWLLTPDAADLQAADTANHAAFQARYEGQRLRVNGRVSGSTVSLGEEVVKLGIRNPGLFAVRFVSPSDASSAARSSSVTVIGTVTCGDRPGVVFLESADLLSSN